MSPAINLVPLPTWAACENSVPLELYGIKYAKVALGLIYPPVGHDVPPQFGEYPTAIVQP